MIWFKIRIATPKFYVHLLHNYTLNYSILLYRMRVISASFKMHARIYFSTCCVVKMVKCIPLNKAVTSSQNLKNISSSTYFFNSPLFSSWSTIITARANVCSTSSNNSWFKFDKEKQRLYQILGSWTASDSSRAQFNSLTSQAILESWNFQTMIYSKNPPIKQKSSHAYAHFCKTRWHFDLRTSCLINMPHATKIMRNELLVYDGGYER